ncbi:MAG TPA: M20 family peptidase [Thermoanaerobaculia bacterium]|nr:M20 family peptidase [Thermoanaerobaculia bacterium]
MKKALAVIGLVLLVLIAVLLVRTGMARSHQIAAAPVTDNSIDARAVAEHLSGAVRFATISHDDGQVERDAFLGLHDYLARSFPLVHAQLTREVVAGYSLLYTWKGRNPSLAPVLLLSHQDVVPVEPGTERAWTRPPFSGAIADGFIWGRGTMDDKAGVLGILEAVEHLLRQGFQPERTVLLAFGHDEEVSGVHGAKNIAALLRQRGVKPEFILDEGGVIAAGMVEGIKAPIALVGTAEKGYVSVDLVARAEGGHSSMPPQHTAIGSLAAAINGLEENQMPARIAGATKESFEYLAPEMPFGPRLFLSNLWLFAPLAERTFASDPASNSRIRTTTAATIINAGVKENVLPHEARAVVNFRILPGDSVADVVAHVRAEAGPDVQVAARQATATEPSPESDVEAPAFRLIQKTVVQVFPGTLVSPNLLAGGTDTKHYKDLTRNVYRFLPARIHKEDLARLHGTNERIGVDTFAGVVRFYVQLLRNAAG